jgi:hypothetical protein
MNHNKTMNGTSAHRDITMFSTGRGDTAHRFLAHRDPRRLKRRSPQEINMGWVHKLLHITPKKELKGISLNLTVPFWKLEGKTDCPSLFRGHMTCYPMDAYCILKAGPPGEGSSTSSMLKQYLNKHMLPLGLFGLDQITTTYLRLQKTLQRLPKVLNHMLNQK